MRRRVVISVTSALLLAVVIVTATRLVPVIQAWWLTEPWTVDLGDGVVLSARVMVADIESFDGAGFSSSSITVLDDVQQPVFHGAFTRTVNGRVRVRAIYRRGRVHGPIRQWNEDGELVLEARAEHGALEGPSWARVWNKEFALQGQWRSGRPVGRFTIEALDDGRIAEDWRFTGALATQYKHGEIHAQYEDVGPESWGSHRFQYEHNFLSAVASWSFGTGWQLGFPYRRRPPFILPDGDTRDAVHHWPWARGPKRAAGRYVNGRATGRWQFWLADGIPSGDFIYEKGEIVSGTARRSGDQENVRYRELEWAEGELRRETWHLKDGSRRVIQYADGERVSDVVMDADGNRDEDPGD